MYNQIVIDELINFIHNNPNLSKEKLTEAVVKKFQLTKDRKLYKMAGNSIVVNCLTEIFKNLKEIIENV